MGWKDPAQRRAYMNARNAKIRSGEHIPNNASKRRGSDMICPQCSKTFYRPPANRAAAGGRGEKDYCSRECMSNAFKGKFVGEKSPRFLQRIDTPCNNCGTVISRPPWQAEKRLELTFCNHTCFGEWKSKNWTGEFNPAWNGGHLHYYGPNWVRQAREARRRDNHECQFCGLPESSLRRALDVHHIRPFRFFGVENCRDANRLANLISLCDRCHTYLEKFSASGDVLTWESLKSLGSLSKKILLSPANDLPAISDS